MKNRIIYITAFDSVTKQEIELNKPFIPTAFDLLVGDFVNITLEDEEFEFFKNEYGFAARDFAYPVFRREYDIDLATMYFHVTFFVTPINTETA